MNDNVERNNVDFESILDRLSKENLTTDANALIARASFMTNALRVDFAMCSLQLVMGYSHCMFSIPSGIFSVEMIGMHKRNVSAGAVYRLLLSNEQKLLSPPDLQQGIKVWIINKISE